MLIMHEDGLFLPTIGVSMEPLHRFASDSIIIIIIIVIVIVLFI